MKMTYENQYGKTLEITKESEIIMTAISGIDPPRASINSAKIAGYDGSTFVSAQAGERNIVITFELKGDIEADRQKLYEIFQIKQKGIFYYASNRMNVKIECRTESVISAPTEFPVTAQVSLLCNDPYFSAMEQILSDISNVDNMFSFPINIDSEGIIFGEVIPNANTNIQNPGNIDIGAVFEVRAIGAVEKPKIINYYTLEYMQLKTTMEAGDLIKISTMQGKLKIELIREGITTNIFNDKMAGSKFLQLHPGDNVFLTDADSGTDNFWIRVFAVPKYTGV